MANKIRSETNIVIDGKSYVMRPTFNALCSIEGRIDKSLITLLCDYDQKGIKLIEQQIIIEEGLKAADEKIPDNLSQLLSGTIKDNLLTIVKFLQQGLSL